MISSNRRCAMNVHANSVLSLSAKFDLVRWGIYTDRMQNVLGAAAADKRWNSQSQSDVKADKTGGKYNFAGTVAAKTEEKTSVLSYPQ